MTEIETIKLKTDGQYAPTPYVYPELGVVCFKNNTANGASVQCMKIEETYLDLGELRAKSNK